MENVRLKKLKKPSPPPPCVSPLRSGSPVRPPQEPDQLSSLANLETAGKKTTTVAPHGHQNGQAHARFGIPDVDSLVNFNGHYFDVIEGLPNATFPMTMNGFTYHPQNEAMLQWFEFESPSSALGGVYRYPDTTVLPHLPAPQLPGCK